MPGNSVYLVEGQDGACESLKAKIRECSSWRLRCFPDAASWLAEAAALAPGCVLLTLDDGPALVERIADADLPHVAIMYGGHGTTASVVDAMKAGAADVVEQTACWDVLASSIAAALQKVRKRQQRLARKQRALELIERLSPRERDVMLGMIEGLPNKLIAYRLGLSPRTVEVHRASLMAKMELGGVVDLLKCALAAELLAA